MISRLGKGAQISAFFAGWALLLFLIQAIPGAALPLVFVGGPLWIGALVYIYLIVIVVQCIRSEINKTWLLAPIGYFVMGYMIHVWTYNAAIGQIRDIREQNLRSKVKLTPPLTFKIEGSLSPSTLVDDYAISQAFSEAREIQGVFGKDVVKPEIATLENRRACQSDQNSEGQFLTPDREGCVVTYNQFLTPDVHYLLIKNSSWNDGILLSTLDTYYLLYDLQTHRLLSRADNKIMYPVTPIVFVLAGCQPDNTTNLRKTKCDIHLLHSKNPACVSPQPSDVTMASVFGMIPRRDDSHISPFSDCKWLIF